MSAVTPPQPEAGDVRSHSPEARRRRSETGDTGSGIGASLRRRLGPGTRVFEAPTTKASFTPVTSPTSRWYRSSPSSSSARRCSN